MAWALSQVRAPCPVCSLYVYLGILTLYPVCTIVLYGLGTVVSLIGTGFLIGVHPNLFFCWLTHAHALKILCANENSSASS